MQPLSLSIPADFSSAAFFIAAACGANRARLNIQNVGLNETRTGFLDLLERMGAQISVEKGESYTGEPRGTILVESSELQGI